MENCENVQDNLTTSEIYSDSIEELMVRAKEIAITGANDSLSAADKTTLADEVQPKLQQELLDLANTQVTASISCRLKAIKPCPSPVRRSPQRHQRSHHAGDQLLPPWPRTSPAKNCS